MQKLAVAAFVTVVAAWCGTTLAQVLQPAAKYPVGMTQVEYVEGGEGGRTLALALFYPATPGATASPMRTTFFTNLRLYMDAPIVADGVKRPLILFSHGRGSNGPYYAWFAQHLVANGYMVGTPYHYRANTYSYCVT